MVRKVLMVVGLLALLLATISPALAFQKPEKENGAKAQGDFLFMAKAFQAVVKSVDAGDDEMVVTTKKYEGDLTVKVNGDTKLRLAKGFAKRVFDDFGLEDFQAGDRVVVKLASRAEDADDLLARSISIVPGRTFMHFSGTVEDVDSDDLSVKHGNTEKSFKLNSNTNVWMGKEAAESDDLDEDQKVTVIARVNGGETPLALSVVIHNDGDEADVEDADDEDSDVDEDDDEDDDEEEEDEGDDEDPGKEKKGPQGQGKGLDK